MSDFETWWKNEGSALYQEPWEDGETQRKWIAEISWLNGAYKENQPKMDKVPKNL